MTQLQLEQVFRFAAFHIGVLLYPISLVSLPYTWPSHMIGVGGERLRAVTAYESSSVYEG